MTWERMWTQTLVHRRNMMWRETWKRWLTPNQGERPRKDPSLTVLKRNEPCQHLNLRFLASRSVRKYIFVVYTIHFYGDLVWTSQVVLVVKNKPANAGDTGDTSLVPGLGRSPGGGHGNPPSILAWRIPWTKKSGGLQFTGAAKSQTKLKWLSMHSKLL